MGFVSAILSASMLFAFSNADSTYKSRPDLAPPRLNITVPCSDACDDGYLFVAPFTGASDTSLGPAQSGSYILTTDGDLVWSGFSYFSPWNCNFQAARWKGDDVLFSFEGAHNGPHGHGHGHHTLLNNRYEVVRELRGGGHYLSDKHEFIILDERTALIQIYQPIQMDLRAYGADDRQTWIVDAIFQELNIETGEVLFEWHSLDHVSPDETALPLPLGQAGVGHNSSTAWDYFHINSVAKGNDGNYLLSARHASTIFSINATDGSIIWRLGGRHSDFDLGPEVEFGFQHHARYLPGGNETVEVISLFDNSVYGSESAGGREVRIYPYSRGKYIAINHEEKTATLVQAFVPPEESILTKSQGSLQTLPNDNVLINWGSEGQLTEYTSDGAIIFHAGFGEGPVGETQQQNYRAFRFPWTGYSPETLAVFAEESADGKTTTAYVSWNGDTRTTSWRFAWIFEASDSEAQHVVTTESRRLGFETTANIDSAGKKVVGLSVEAQDEDGQVLVKSDTVRVFASISYGDRDRSIVRGGPSSRKGSNFLQEFLGSQELRR